RDYFVAEADEAFDEVAKGQRFRTAAADGEPVRGEARLGRSVPPELVEHHFGRRVALEVDDDADTGATGLVANVGHALDALVLRGLGDLLHQTRLADLIGYFGQHDRTAVTTAFLDRVLRPHHDRAATRGVGAADTGLAEDLGAGREVRAFHIFH